MRTKWDIDEKCLTSDYPPGHQTSVKVERNHLLQKVNRPTLNIYWHTSRVVGFLGNALRRLHPSGLHSLALSLISDQVNGILWQNGPFILRRWEDRLPLSLEAGLWLRLKHVQSVSSSLKTHRRSWRCSRRTVQRWTRPPGSAESAVSILRDETCLVERYETRRRRHQGLNINRHKYQASKYFKPHFKVRQKFTWPYITVSLRKKTVVGVLCGILLSLITSRQDSRRKRRMKRMRQECINYRSSPAEFTNCLSVQQRALLVPGGHRAGAETPPAPSPLGRRGRGRALISTTSAPPLRSDCTVSFQTHYKRSNSLW